MKIYIQRFLGDAMPLIPLSGLYFLHLGFSLTQISALFLQYAIWTAILEVPTGYLADRTSHRSAMITAKILKLIAFIPWVFFPSYLWISVGFFVWSLASALDSGAFQSYLADLVEENEFQKVYGRSLTVSLVAFTLGALSYSLVPIVGFYTLGLIGLGMLAGSVVVSLALPRVTEQHKEEQSEVREKLSFSKILTPSFAMVLSLVLIGAFAGGIKGTLDEYSGLLLSSTNTLALGIGLSLGLLEIVKAFGTGLAHHVSLGVSKQKYVLLLLAFVFIVVGKLPLYLIVILLMLVLVIDGVLWVHNDSAIQKYAPKHLRATITSLKSLCGETVATLFLGAVTLMSIGKVEYIYMVGGFILVLGFVVVIAVNYFLAKK